MSLLESIANPFAGNLGIGRQVSRLFFPREYKIGYVDVDTVLDESHTLTATKTSYPIETGATVTDHVTIQPARVIVSGLISDINNNEFADFGITGQAQQMFGDKNTRSSSIWQQLKTAMENREGLLLTTNIQSYPNMIIVSLATRQDKDTVNAVFFDVTLEESQEFLSGEHEPIYEIENTEQQKTETAKTNKPTANRTRKKIDEGVKKPNSTPKSSILKKASELIKGLYGN